MRQFDWPSPKLSETLTERHVQRSASRLGRTAPCLLSLDLPAAVFCLVGRNALASRARVEVRRDLRYMVCTWCEVVLGAASRSQPTGAWETQLAKYFRRLRKARVAQRWLCASRADTATCGCGCPTATKLNDGAYVDARSAAQQTEARRCCG
jgi:hypothetical protein